jgi:hypothetical protein
MPVLPHGSTLKLEKITRRAEVSGMQTEEVRLGCIIKGRLGAPVGVGELTATIYTPPSGSHGAQSEARTWDKVEFPVLDPDKTDEAHLTGDNLKAALYALAQLDVKLVEAGFKLEETGPYWFRRHYRRPYVAENRR